MDVRGESNPVIRIAERRIAGLTDKLNLTPKRSKTLANRAGFNLLTSALRAFWVCSFRPNQRTKSCSNREFLRVSSGLQTKLNPSPHRFPVAASQRRHKRK